MEMAELVSSMSKDPSTQCGAVLVRPNKTIASIGFNGLPARIEDHKDILENRELKYKYVVHAEQNAMDNGRDESYEGYAMFIHPFMPCCRCATSMVNRGIASVFVPPTPQDKLERYEEEFKISENILWDGGIELNTVTL